jgi:hypothetical protein
MLGKVRDTFLSDDNVWLDSHDVLAHAQDLSLFHGKSFLEVVLLGELHVGHRLSLLVLKRAIEKNNTGVGDVSAHLGVSDVLVEHNSIKNSAVLEHTTGDLFNLGVSLYIDFNIFLSILSVDGPDGLDSEVNDKTAPLA